LRKEQKNEECGTCHLLKRSKILIWKNLIGHAESTDGLKFILLQGFLLWIKTAGPLFLS
jgi:hypothetical protein